MSAFWIWSAPALSKCSHNDPFRKWYVMAAVAIGIFLATIDASIVNIALLLSLWALWQERRMRAARQPAHAEPR